MKTAGDGKKCGGYPDMEMDNFTFGLTMMICGMGGTLATLWIMSLVMMILDRIFPFKPEENTKET
jgi:Na+-transporting methylmalonyl-CoA/oxaloacetate decarboxylase gamma subunit